MQMITVLGKITQDIKMTKAPNGVDMTYLKLVEVDNGAPVFIDFLLLGNLARQAKDAVVGKMVYVEGYVRNKREEIDGKMNYNFSFHAMKIKIFD